MGNLSITSTASIYDHSVVSNEEEADSSNLEKAAEENMNTVGPPVAAMPLYLRPQMQVEAFLCNLWQNATNQPWILTPIAEKVWNNMRRLFDPFWILTNALIGGMLLLILIVFICLL